MSIGGFIQLDVTIPEEIKTGWLFKPFRRVRKTNGANQEVAPFPSIIFKVLS
jgi:hypothetical protein